MNLTNVCNLCKKESDDIECRICNSSVCESCTVTKFIEDVCKKCLSRIPDFIKNNEACLEFIIGVSSENPKILDAIEQRDKNIITILSLDDDHSRLKYGRLSDINEVERFIIDNSNGDELTDLVGGCYIIEGNRAYKAKLRLKLEIKDLSAV